MRDRTLIVISGGTIDARAYRETPVNITPLESSIIPDSLKKLKLAEECVCFTWLRKDSKEFTETELRELAELIREHDFTRVVITHGTDRMVENARSMQQLRKMLGGDKVVMFTGSMIPIANELEGICKSDGYDNLRFAIEQARTAPAGVYIAFTEKLFDPSRTKKDYEKKVFVEVEN